MEPQVDRRLAALLHGDVVGYSRLMAADESATVSGLRGVQGIVEGIARQHRGRLVDFTGDAFLAEFPSAVDAATAALAIQRESAALASSTAEAHRLRLRLGVHAGEVRAEGERIFGDAINVAARLQALAEPGGICISDTLREQLEGKLPVRLRDLGPQVLKNLARPVHAFAISPGPPLPAGEPALVPGFSGRPAIAVLAFAPFGGEPEQEYLGDGIAEDLITRLATHRDFPVIARNSSFAYKSRAVDVKEIGRQLGVAYLIEGSVRRAGSRVRITAQLVDARTGHHLWAERYDRELADVFAIQDEIVDAVVACVYPEVIRAERDRARRQDPASLDAWESVVLARWHLDSRKREDTARALQLAVNALQLDPGCVEAVRILQEGHVRARVSQWNELLTHDNRGLHDLARHALEVSGESPVGLMALGTVLTLLGQFDRGVEALERAVRLNPSSANALVALANALARGDRSAEALPLLESAARLDPRTSDVHFREFTSALSYWALGRFAEAVGAAERALSQGDSHAGTLRILIASQVELGQLQAAQGAARRLLEVSPDFRVSLLEQMIPWQPALVPRFQSALRRAGLPE